MSSPTWVQAPEVYSSTRARPHGLGDPRASRLSILSDFLLFTKLCVQRGVVPRRGGWDWDDYLGAAAGMLQALADETPVATTPSRSAARGRPPRQTPRRAAAGSER